MNRLWGMRVYLCGPMDRVEDGGIVWRERLTPWLEQRGLVVLNPANKPIDIGIEDQKHIEERRVWKKKGDFDRIAGDMRQLRVVDLRMVDMSDFIIAYIRTDVHMRGSYEEIDWANRLKRPILYICPTGKIDIPDWEFGVVPHEFFFESFDQIKTYLEGIDIGRDNRHFKRWMFFEYHKMLPKVPYNFEFGGKVEITCSL